MPEESRCWFCHRSDAEVSTFADIETAKEKELLQQMSQVTSSKADFIQQGDVWRKGIPRELKEFDFKFVTSNADQFKPIRIGNGLLGEIVAPNKLLAEIGAAKKLTADWLEDLALALQKGDGEIPGFGALSLFEKADRDQLSRMVSEFEEKWHRRIGSGNAGRGYNQGFDGLKLFDGLEFMTAVGILYYDVQAQLLDMARRKEKNSKPKRGVSALLVNGYPPVPICSVCLDVMKELGPRQLAAEPPVAQQVPIERHHIR